MLGKERRTVIGQETSRRRISHASVRFVAVTSGMVVEGNHSLNAD
jgi:hypothetical protein